MAKDFYEFMEDALGDDSLKRAFEDKFNELYPAGGVPVKDADEKLSDWFGVKGYAIPNRQCKKFRPAFDAARGGPGIQPLY